MSMAASLLWFLNRVACVHELTSVRFTRRWIRLMRRGWSSCRHSSHKMPAGKRSDWSKGFHHTFRNFCLQLPVRVCVSQVSQNRSTEDGLYSCTRIQQILSTRNHRSTRIDCSFLTRRYFVQRNHFPNIRSLWPKIICDKRDGGIHHNPCCWFGWDVRKEVEMHFDLLLEECVANCLEGKCLLVKLLVFDYCFLQIRCVSWLCAAWLASVQILIASPRIKAW